MRLELKVFGLISETVYFNAQFPTICNWAESLNAQAHSTKWLVTLYGNYGICGNILYGNDVRSIFRNAYFLQPLFWRLYVVALLVALKPDSML